MRLLLYFFVITTITWSQDINLCGTDFVMKKYRESQKYQNLKKQAFLSQDSFAASKGGFKIIPVVFHIIHSGDPIGEGENISVEQINDALRIMNEDFSADNIDLENVSTEFEDIVGNGNIEFRLAQLDPSGNCSNGINRIFSEMTDNANDCVKTLVSWDDTKYLNIWVVKDIDPEIGAAAYTYLPDVWLQQAHGIIINHQYVGSIGTSLGTTYARHTLTHEVGHYLNLEHTWGYGSNGDENNCSIDDGVTDTPNTIGAYSTCNLSQETCGSLDNIQNFMDYASCTAMFTQGQVDRMQSCLSNPFYGRNNLWSENNLWETGVHNDYDNVECNSNVDFFISASDRLCISSPIMLINNSQILGENPIFSWSFMGAEIEFSSEENPLVLYSQPGEYEITLNILTDLGESSTTKTYTIYDSQINLNEDFENTQFPINQDPSLSWSIDAPQDETSWQRTPISSTSTTGSVRIRSRYFDCYRKHYLYTPNLNLSNFGLGIGEPLKLLFDLAYGKRNNQTEDLLVVSYSKDCGDTWQIRKSWETDQLVTNNDGNVGNNFIPTNNEWSEQIVNIQPAAEETDVIIRFEFSGDAGSYLYIDNIRLTGEWINTSEIENPAIYVVKTIDLFGRENKQSNFYISIYNDGSIQKYYEFK